MTNFLPSADAAPRVLAVVDWTADPAQAVAAIRCAAPGSEVTIVVPATLHGIDKIGDPHASIPCAQRQARALRHAATQVGMSLRYSAAGDPDPVSAAVDFCLRWDFSEVLVALPSHGLRFAAVASRVGRATGVASRPLIFGRAGRPRRLVGSRARCERPASQVRAAGR